MLLVSLVLSGSALVVALITFGLVLRFIVRERQRYETFFPETSSTHNQALDELSTLGEVLASYERRYERDEELSDSPTTDEREWFAEQQEHDKQNAV